MTVERVAVGLGDRSYDIHVGSGLIARAGELLGDLLSGRQVVIVADQALSGSRCN